MESLVKKAIRFRRGKTFQAAYFDIGTANRAINNLLIEVETHERYGNLIEAKSKNELANKLKTDLLNKYSPDVFDLDYCLPQVTGLYVRQSRRDILK